jgi:hypothetical protein
MSVLGQKLTRALASSATAFFCILATMDWLNRIAEVIGNPGIDEGGTWTRALPRNGLTDET